MIGKKDNIAMVATLGGVGFLPFMPGTAGSIVGCVWWYFFGYASVLLSSVVLFCVAIAGGWCAHYCALSARKVDPSFVVIDEFVGMGCALIALPHSVVFYVLAFCFFRLFDICKIGPVAWAERLPGGWGIMADDIVAGLLSFVCVYAIIQCV